MRVDGLDYAEAVEALEHWTGPRIPTAPPDDDARTRASAMRLWSNAVPIAGTLAEQYLRNRFIDVAALPENLGEILRFHPNCPFGKGTRHPCLIALFRDLETNEPAGIHRIALTADAQKIERRMLGKWPGGRAIKMWPVGEGNSLVIGEGLETTLAAATRVMHRGAALRPAWAIGSANGIAGSRLPIMSITSPSSSITTPSAVMTRASAHAPGRPPDTPPLFSPRAKPVPISTTLRRSCPMGDAQPLYDEEVFEPKGASTATVDSDPWPVMAPVAYHGLVGEIVSVLAPETEATRSPC